jgi:hypothetical protein
MYSISPSGISDLCGTAAGMVTPKESMSTERERDYKFLSFLTSARYVHPWWRIEHLTNVSRTRPTVSADGPGRPVRFAAHSQQLCWNFLDHSRIFLSVGGSGWYMVRNLLCTVTMDSVLANSKLQNAFLFPVHATALQTGRSENWFPMVSLAFFIDIILPVALWC